MKVKARHIIWLLYCLGIGAYAVRFHFSDKTDARMEAAGRFAIMALMFLVVLIIGTILEKVAERRKGRGSE